MTALYNFLTVHRPAPQAMAAALAEAIGVPVSGVDVADEDTGQPDDRNWDAPVLCTHRSAAGDLALSWDVSVSDAVAAAPSEAGAALRLAARLGTTVLHPAQESAPSAYWAVGPDGAVARARVLEADEGDGPPCLVVDAVDAPMGQLPAARVEVLAETLRAERWETPVTDTFAAAADPDGEAPATGTVNRAREALLLWERLVRRIDAGWLPDGRYPFELYAEDLRTRDRLEELAAAAGPERERLGSAVAELDAVFRRGTNADSGALLGRLTGSGSAVVDRGWWWHRRPAKLPWDGG
ncbi:hypothetical protein ACFYY2_07240 [Streptomyces sp. NPDC001822]|uniref:hypothetical protein n=1 Tax=Streptomyces sp. NPDC001822 TaxID=3364614 RepID=UPI00368B7BD5